MKQPESTTFIAEVEQAFGFLLDHGFTSTQSDRTDTALTVGLRYRGKNIAVDLDLDRRDACVDCYVTRVVNGNLVRNSVSEGYSGSLHAFLVTHRGYRCGFKEFCDEVKGEEWFVTNLKTYAKALQKLAPDIVADSESVFEK
jgi:hypothetical protein